MKLPATSANRRLRIAKSDRGRRTVRVRTVRTGSSRTGGSWETDDLGKAWVDRRPAPPDCSRLLGHLRARVRKCSAPPRAPRLAPRRRDELLRPTDPGGCDSPRRMDVLTGRSQAFPLDSGPFRRRLQDGLFATWMFWFVAAIIGIGTLRLAFPELSCTIICLPRGWLLLPYFPFVPSVFAPVVLGHAFFFRMESRLLGPLPARTVTRAAQILSGLAVTAIVIQAGGLFSGWAYLLAGFTAPGYFLAAVGFRRAWREVSSFTGISTDVARRSPGL